MKKKDMRLDLIKKIIATKEIRSQEELLKELSDNGINLTQATLSRDLKQLKVAKTANEQNRYVYMLPDEMVRHHFNMTQSSIHFQGGFISLDFSGNLAVVHTRPGHANALALDIDGYNHEDIMGTIAGDDTILIVLKPGAAQNEIKNVISEVLSN